MSGDAKLLYAVLLDRMSLSIKNGWQDKHGNAYIICTIEEVMDSIHCARQKAVKLLDELEQEFQLIERRRQGLGKPNLLYVKDLYAGLSQSNYWKYENHTSGGLKNELPGVPKSNGSNTEKINKTDNSETDLIYPAELQEEQYGQQTSQKEDVMKAIRWLLKLILVMITLPLILAVWLAKWFVVFLHHCSAWIFYLLGSVLLATAVLSFLMQQSQGVEALQMLIGGFAIFMIPQVVGVVVVLLELAAVMLRQAWYI